MTPKLPLSSTSYLVKQGVKAAVSVLGLSKIEQVGPARAWGGDHRFIIRVHATARGVRGQELIKVVIYRHDSTLADSPQRQQATRRVTILGLQIA